MVSPMFIVGSILGCVHSNHVGTFWQVEIRAICVWPELGRKS
jgi:hypothetical protein